MDKLTTRRQLMAAAFAAGLSPAVLAQTVAPATVKRAANAARPLRIYAITFRGLTDVER